MIRYLVTGVLSPLFIVASVFLTSTGKAESKAGTEALQSSKESVFFLEMNNQARRVVEFPAQYKALLKELAKLGAQTDAAWVGVSHFYLRIKCATSENKLASELQRLPGVGKVIAAASAPQELFDLNKLEKIDSVSTISATKLRGLHEKRRGFPVVAKSRHNDEIIVKYLDESVETPAKRSAAQEKIGALHAAIGSRLAKRMELSTGVFDVVTRPSTMDIDEALRRYNEDENVEYAEPNYVYETNVTPNDTFWSSLWGMPKISAPNAWNTRTSASSIVVAVTDTGIDYNHPDLSGNIWISGGYHGYNAVAQTNDPMDDNVRTVYWWNDCTGFYTAVTFEDYHGTHVAGTIGATGNNSAGVAGVAWSTQLMAVKVLASSGSGTAADIADGLDYARNHGASIINASWGGGGYSQTIYDAIDALRNANIIFVNAAGNSNADNDSTIVYPAGFGMPNMVVVNASDASDDRSLWNVSYPCYPMYSYSSGSNYGRWSTDVFAPGTDIYSTQQNSRYQYLSGTSMAAPHVTGMLALAKAEFPSESATELVDRARFSVDSVMALQSLCMSGGRINAEKTLSSRPRIFQGSARCQVGTGDAITIGGLRINGSSSKRVAFRVWGPSLASLGISGAIADPQISIYNSSGTLIASNDNWGTLSTADKNELTSFGIAPVNSLDSAWIGNLVPGSYTVHVSGVGGVTGIAMLETWDIDGSTVNRLINTSARCYVGTGAQIGIAGIAISGDKPRQVYIRALGPTLANFGISGALQDTVLSLYDSNGSLVASNDDWRDFDGSSTALETRLSELGNPPLDDRESAIVARLQPGNYSVQLTGKSGTIGIALLEVNEY